jgi:hypothetical protein
MLTTLLTILTISTVTLAANYSMLEVIYRDTLNKPKSPN